MMSCSRLFCVCLMNFHCLRIKSRCSSLAAAAVVWSMNLTRRGYDVTGVDHSEEGIVQSLRRYPDLNVPRGSSYDDLTGQYGQFPVVLSLEVVEHVYAPRHYARTVFDLLAGGARPSSRPLITATGRTSRWH